MKSTISKIAAIAFLAFAGVQVHAFVNTQDTVAVAEDSSSLMEQIEAIAQQIADKSITTEEALAKINDAIDQIDELLDGEPSNEGDLLDLRDALVDMRLELSTVEGTETKVGLGDGNIISDSLISSTPIGDGAIFSGGGAVGGGGGACCGGGGGGGLGGFLTSPLGLGAIAGTVVAIAVSGDDDPASL